MAKTPVDKWIIEPVQRFINNSSTSGILLFSSALLAILLSNSPWSHEFHELWEIELSVGFHGTVISKSLHHWINDGLMAVFFFVVGLELKREFVAGELRDPSQAILPVVSALGGMIIPASLYIAFNSTGPTSDGWGIPMATDIAFALGVLYLLGDRVPLSLKVFLTTLAIVDDIGSVLVIAFFYTSNIDMVSLGTGGLFMAVLIIANLIGVRNTLFYAIVGIGGLWMAFLMSGVHATIAAVLAAMTIPVRVKITDKEYVTRIRKAINRFEEMKSHPHGIVTEDQLDLIEDVRTYSKKALTPLQRLEHRMHPVVAFVIMPIFALSNAGMMFSEDVFSMFSNTVFWGVLIGLIAGKVAGVYGLTSLLIRMNWVKLPKGMTKQHLLGAGFLAAIGFTMSLFVSELAFDNKAYIEQAKMGILLASVVASFIGYFIIRRTPLVSDTVS